MEGDREFTRIERRAMAAYERELLADLRELAIVEAGCRTVRTYAAGLGSIEVQVCGRTLILAGVTPRAIAEVTELAMAAEVRVVDAGRYDSRWWIALSDGARQVVVLALRAQLRPDDGGIRHLVRVA